MNVRSNTSNITKQELRRRMEVPMAVDPVCGIPVDEQVSQPTKQYTAQYGGQTFYFCSEDCQEVFEESPHQHAQRPA
jgi:YHS domain-containing protein